MSSHVCRTDQWGDKGYIRLARGHESNAPGQCGIAMQPSYPVKTGPNPPPAPPTPSPKPGPTPPPTPEPEMCDTTTQCPAGKSGACPWLALQLHLCALHVTVRFVAPAHALHLLYHLCMCLCQACLSYMHHCCFATALAAVSLDYIETICLRQCNCN